MIKTERLILRPWRKEDLEPFAKLNTDPRVREFLYPTVLSKEASDQLVKQIEAKIEKNGWGMWAVSVPGIAEFIGFIGLNYLDPSDFPAPFTPAVEIGWRLSYEYWGKGYATEGALACLQYGFKTLNLDEIVAITTVRNERSQAVMKRISMHHDAKDDFNHPHVPEDHPLSRHVLYRIKFNEWQDAKNNHEKSNNP